MYDANARYQELAARFLADTGLLAPGKVVGHLSEEHKATWWAWWAANHRIGEPQDLYPGHLAPPKPPPAAPRLPQAGLFW